MQENARTLELEGEPHLDQPQTFQRSMHRFLTLFTAVDHQKAAAAGAGDFAAASARCSRSGVCFIDSAVGDAAGELLLVAPAFIEHGAKIVEAPLFKRRLDLPSEFLDAMQRFDRFPAALLAAFPLLAEDLARWRVAPV